MRKLSLIAIALMVCLVASPAFAWEFSMSGAFVQEYRYLTQMGDNGLLGPKDLVGPNPGVAEAPNLWTGIHFQQISGQQYSGSSVATTHAQYMNIEPQIRVNKAVRIRGRYRIGNDNTWNTFDPKYYNSMEPGPWRAFADGQWMMLWATAQTPWGIIAAGKRPFAFGTGLMFDGTVNTTTESVLFVAPYGPFRFLIGFYPARSTGWTMNRASKKGNEEHEWAFVLTYSCGPLQLGTFWDWIQLEAGREGGGLQFAGGDHWSGSVLVTDHYMKYNNGRVFLNAEVATYDRTIRRLQAIPLYVNHWRWMVEGGFMFGPSKVSVLYATVWGGESLTFQTSYSAGLGNTTVFTPYSLLMVRNYGLGTQFSGTAWEGNMDNAWCLALRHDYAVAANLNLWASFFTAWRKFRETESWGCINLSGAGAAHTGMVEFGPIPGASRWIPNDDLGWEVYVGADWKLLEGLRVTLEGAYFQAGDWWKHACVSTTRGAAAMVAGGNAGVDPWREIDPVVAFYLTANFEF
jgi:hypothetical protein